MKKSRGASAAQLYTPRATLCALGLKVRSLQLFKTIAEHVRIRQQTIGHIPLEKSQDAFSSILTGTHRLVEVKTRVRCDAALQRAFGRHGCAEQSVAQETLDRCAVAHGREREIEDAVAAIFRAHCRAYRHDYERGLLLLDIDLTGLPCGRSGEAAEVGYLSGYGIRHGRRTLPRQPATRKHLATLGRGAGAGA